MRHSALERPSAPGFLIFQRSLNRGVETARCKIRLKARINAVRMMLIEPEVEFLDLFRSQTVYSAFDFLNGVRLHGSSFLTLYCIEHLPGSLPLLTFVLDSHCHFVPLRLNLTPHEPERRNSSAHCRRSRGQNPRVA